MTLEQVIQAVTTAPMSVIGLPGANLLSPGAPAELTVFDLVDADVKITDSMGDEAHLSRLIEPRLSIIGAKAIAAERHVPPSATPCPCCGNLPG
jgi:dihydroorotase